MRSTITLLLTTLATAALMALSAAPASADGVEVLNEEAGGHCADISLDEHTVSGGCVIHATSEHVEPTELRSHDPVTGEAVFTACEDAYVVHIDENGHGFITDQVVSQPEAGTCFLEPCDENEANLHADIPWPFHSYEFAAQENLALTFCIQFFTTDPSQEGNAGLQLPCTLAVPLADEDVHDYELRTNPSGASSRCSQSPGVSIDGHWIVAPNSPDTIEITHEPDE